MPSLDRYLEVFSVSPRFRTPQPAYIIEITNVRVASRRVVVAAVNALGRRNHGRSAANATRLCDVAVSRWRQSTLRSCQTGSAGVNFMVASDYMGVSIIQPRKSGGA